MGDIKTTVAFKGVVFFFGMLAHPMGFRVLSFHTRFPDCEPMREVRPMPWQRVGIEFEYESRNYRIHKHRSDGCDLIVCWRHNWPGCPRSLEVIELKGLGGDREGVDSAQRDGPRRPSGFLA